MYKYGKVLPTGQCGRADQLEPAETFNRGVQRECLKSQQLTIPRFRLGLNGSSHRRQSCKCKVIYLFRLFLFFFSYWLSWFKETKISAPVAMNSTTTCGADDGRRHRWLFSQISRLISLIWPFPNDDIARKGAQSVPSKRWGAAVPTHGAQSRAPQACSSGVMATRRNGQENGQWVDVSLKLCSRNLSQFKRFSGRSFQATVSG